MLFICKTRNAQGGWTWRIGQAALAFSYTTPQTEPGLFLFSISGVHQQSAELFSTDVRAEALLQKHLSCAVQFVEHAMKQTIAITREERWIKLQRDDPPESERDDYTYRIGNVVLGTLSNSKNIRTNGYHLHISRRPYQSPATGILSVTEGEQLLCAALECTARIERGTVGYFLGPNQQPCDAAGFTARPTLYDGRPAW
jgi:hypothetical protein